MALVFASLLVSMLIVGAICLAMFFSVAFEVPQFALDATKRPAGWSWSLNRTWQPPLLRGYDLLQWARTTAETVTRRWLSGHRSGRTAVGLASELHEVTSFVLHQQPDTLGRAPRKVGCPTDCYAMIAVTAPEAIQMAEYIRRRLPGEAVRRIHDRAQANGEVTAEMGARQYSERDIRCPLLCDDNECCAFSVRPIHCRGGCPLSAMLVVGEADEPERAAAGDRAGKSASADSTNRHDLPGHLVARGIECGVSQALDSAGLDGSLYELNSALVAALDHPDAADRWVRGEEVFERCKRYESSE